MAIERLTEAQPILAKVMANFQVKIIFGIIFGFMFDVSKQPALIAIFGLIIFDFITGYAGAKYTGEQIKSAKIFRTAVKLITYFGVISAGFLLEKAIGFNAGADDLLIVFFGATEFISILENMGKLGFQTPKRLLNIAQDIKNNADKK